MARTGQKQVPLGPTQPSFPDGWVMAVLDAFRSFAPELAHSHRLPKVSRTASRMRSGLGVEPETSEAWASRLTRIVAEFFPRVAGINGFAANYVREYFGLWKVSAAAAPRWVEVAGAKPATPAVLARMLIRDLLLRLCYLECCERRLTGHPTVVFFDHSCPEAIYRSLVDRSKPAGKDGEEKLAAELKVSSRTIRRWLSGQAVPKRQNFRALAPSGDHRLLGGIGFMDRLLGELGLREGPLAGELLHTAGLVLSHHASALADFRGHVPDGHGERSCDFEEFAGFGENLLLHPGFADLQGRMPDALWRVHVHALRFGRLFDLAQAYLRFAEPENDQGLLDYLEQAERRGDPLRLLT